MSFFKNKNDGGKADIKLDDKTTSVQDTQPTDPTKLLWVDTKA